MTPPPTPAEPGLPLDRSPAPPPGRSAPTPQQARDLLSRVESAQTTARTDDSWPLVAFLLSLSAAVSVALVAVGAIDDNGTGLLVVLAAGLWLIPTLIVYLRTARSWSARSTMLLSIWLPIIVVDYIVSIAADSLITGTSIPFLGAAVLWIAAPIMAFIGLRR